MSGPSSSEGREIRPTRNYSCADVAQWLGHSRDWLYENLPRLYEEGFPRPVSKVGNPRWSGTGLIAWQQRPLVDLAAMADPSTANVVGLAELLARRAKKAAARA